MTISASAMARTASGVACPSAPGPIPTIARTPVVSDMTRHHSARCARNAGHCDGHGTTRARLGVYLLRNEKLRRPRSEQRSRFGNAPRANKVPYGLGGILDPRDLIELFGCENTERASEALGKRTKRVLFFFLIDGCHRLHAPWRQAALVKDLGYAVVDHFDRCPAVAANAEDKALRP